MEEKKKPNIFEKYIIFTENNIGTIKAVAYGITSISLAIALYRIRPFSKFRKPSSVPSHFLQNKVPLQATVMRIEPSHGALLMADHKPLIPLPRLDHSTFLPVKIAGLNVTSNGISWLQTIVKGNNIRLIPLTPTKDYLDCIVILFQKNKEEIKIGEELVKLGFATVEKDSLKSLLNDKVISHYQKSLLSAEKWAERRRNGYWQFKKQPTISWKFEESLREIVKNMMPKFVTQVRN